MAVLQPTASKSSRIKSQEPPPKGRYIATCILNEDQLGVERTKFESQDVEKVDLTAFYFGITDKAGNQYAVRSREMKISLNEKAALVKFLKSWRGSNPPAGFDTASMVGQGAEIRIEHVESQRTPGRYFANISDIAPVEDEHAGRIKPVGVYLHLLNAPAGTAQEQDGDEMPF